MKKNLLLFLLLFAFTAFAQTKYDKLWREVENFELEGKFKSAQKKTNEVLSLARNLNTTNQIIKAFIYKTKFVLLLEEDAHIKVIEELEELIKVSNFPTDAILESVYASYLHQYLLMYRFKIKKRSKTDEIQKNSKDFEYWDTHTFITHISKHYKESLSLSNRLQKLSIKKFAPFLTNSKTSFKYRPTLFDFLAHEALSFYSTDKWKMRLFKNDFSTNEEFTLKPTEVFLKNKLDAQQDKVVSINTPLEIFQELENFHFKKDTTAYVDNVLQRLEFCKNKSNLVRANDIFLSTLNFLSKKYQNHEVQATIIHKMAEFYFNASKKENAKNHETLKNYRVKAKTLCDIGIKKFPHSDGGILCTLLKKKIEDKSVNIQTERYVVPGKPFLAKINFKNIDSLYLTVYKIPFNKFQNPFIQRKDSIAFQIAKTQKPVKTKLYCLQEKNDYFSYTTEIDLPALSKGSYLIVTSSEKNSTSFKNILSHCVITATNLSLIKIKNDKKIVIKILDRQNGHPVHKAKILYRNSKNKLGSGTTNSSGKFIIKKDKKYYNSVEILTSFKGDTLATDNIYISKFYDDNKSEDINKSVKMFLFLDRSIYRPGQTVYFKGILTEKSKNKSKIVPKTHVNIIIQNSNYQIIKKFRLKTNEFGSVSGEFKLPKNVLTGEFSILMDETEDNYYDDIDDFEDTEIYFSVEEYKRPKFEIVFDSIKSDNKLNEEVTIKGFAKAFLGSKISNAKVNYSVTRSLLSNNQNRYNYNYRNKILQKGTLHSNQNGEFNITFKATPDSLIQKSTKPIFIYNIKVNVTDINGETRTSTKSIKLGYHNSTLNVNTEKKWLANASQKITVETKNLNNKYISTDLHYTIYKLKSSNRILRDKPWPVVEKHYLSREKFIKLFPNEVYDKFDLQENWLKGELKFSGKQKNNGKSILTINNTNNWEPGSYQIEIKAIDQFKDTLFITKQIELFQSNQRKINGQNLLSHKITNSSFKRDGYINLMLSTVCKDINVNIEAYYKGKLILDKLSSIKNGHQAIKIPIKRKYRDAIDIKIYYVKFNSSYSSEFSVDLSSFNDVLKFETISFRNKIKPGDKESWSFKVLNIKGKNTNAEVLASMYDQSLDKLKDHYWENDFNIYGSSNYTTPSIENNYSFRNTQFKFIKIPNTLYFSSSVKNYQEFEWSGLNFGNISSENKLYLSTLKNKLTPKNHKSGNIRGIIFDDIGYPLPGANVIVKGTNISTETDFDGFYTINAPLNSELEFRFVGYETKSAIIKKPGTYNIALETDNLLEEVVVVGYGTTTKRASLSASLLISGGNFINHLKEQLGGSISGVTIQESYNTPAQKKSIIIKEIIKENNSEKTLFVIDGVTLDVIDIELALNDIEDITILKAKQAIKKYGTKGKNGVVIITTKQEIAKLNQVETRNDLRETAFFYPHIKTNKKGEAIFNFNSPQALTKWKLMLLAHNKSFEVGTLEKSVLTQKQLNIIPNPPRFLRGNDTIVFNTKISNLTSKKTNGNAVLYLTDPTTSSAISNVIIETKQVQEFTISPQGNTSISWKIVVPKGIPALEYKIIAKSDSHSDGEKNILPILNNKTLVTEARPIWLPKGKKQEFTFKTLKESSSKTLENHNYTIEYSTNETWLALKSLPYLMEFPYECAEQTFSRFYANVIAKHLLDSNPEIKNVIESWVSKQEIKSPLEENEKLKSILNTESPWVRDLKSDKENKSRFAQLFKSQQLKDNLLQTTAKLKELQLSTGGFPWFAGGRENNFITRHIISGIGHLNKIGINNYHLLEPILKKGIPFLDEQFASEYHFKIQHKVDSTKIIPDYNNIHYLYARSFFIKSHPIPEKIKPIFNLYLEKCKSSWLTKSLYEKGMIALVLNRLNFKKGALKIIEALEEQSVKSKNAGWYWKENNSSWKWNESQIETHALLIEAFNEIQKDKGKVTQLKQWLIKNKKLKQWETTKATTEAIQALLINQNDLKSISNQTTISFEGRKINANEIKNIKKEKETGYVKINWKTSQITPQMGTVKIENDSESLGYGGIYWQYLEDIDKINTTTTTPLQIKKKLFLKDGVDDNKKLIRISPNSVIKVGDLITVRLEIISKNDMEFVHLKDMRASGFEPVDIISQYKWFDDIDYYQSMKDTATNFFFDDLPKGKYIIEYQLRASNSGNFSNGITTIQSMYAPEFISHSKSTRVKIQ